VVAACWAALGTGGRLVANAVTIEGEQALAGWRARLGGFTAWRPALPVTQWAAIKAVTQEDS
jgi:precorrin-6B C5,15-methyltransferase / cobalt-precorrin-6B C5,C15-methyltransferase